MNFNKRLIQMAVKEGKWFLLTILCSFLAGGLIIFQSLELSKAVSNVFLDEFTLRQVLPTLRLVLVVVLVRMIFTILNDGFAGRLTVNIKTHLRESILHKISRLGPAFLKRERTAELATTAIQGVDALDAYFSHYLPQIIIAALLPLTILVIVFPLDILTGVILLLTAPLIPLFMVLIGWTSEAVTKKQWLSLTRLGDYFLDTLQGIAALKTLGRSKDRLEEIRNVNDRYRVSTLAVLKVTFLSALVLEMIATIATALVAVEIGLRLLYSRIEFQQAFFILLIAPEFYLPLRNLSARYHAGMKGVTAAKRIFELLDMPEREFPIQNGVQPDSSPFDGNFTIEFRNIIFSYPSRLENAVTNINLTLHQGRHYALVGPSGAGKSTLTQLILRFIEPDSGQLLINEVDARLWTLENWRRWIVWVPQKPVMFNTSLLENVRLWQPVYSETMVENALWKAGLHELVNVLPDGLHTQVGENGARISGGEAQRVALARAFLKDAPLLLMDEPTAHLDAEMEASLLKSMQRLTEGRTTVTIAHRISTIRQADEIIVMNAGRIMDSGGHTDLVSRCVLYRDLVKAGGGQK